MGEVTVEERFEALQRQRVAERKQFAQAVWEYDERGCDAGARDFLREAGISDEELVEWGMAAPPPPEQRTVRMVIELNVEWDDVPHDDDDWMDALAKQIEDALEGATEHACYPVASRLVEGLASYRDRDHQAVVVPTEQEVFADAG